MGDEAFGSELFLSEHTRSMRKALSFLENRVEELLISEAEVDPSSCITITKPWAGSVAVIDCMPSAKVFRRDYQQANQPCIIKDKKWCSDHFGRTVDCMVRSLPGNKQGSNRFFFQEVLGGPNAKVPVRYTIGSKGRIAYSEEKEVDDEGRAEECEMKEMALTNWFDILDSTKANKSSYYLKDWHFQLTSNEPKYTVPDHFQIDLLNGLFLRFTDGDFRFTYWGPAGSKTTYHTDVLNSFSWSFNVYGAKEWTFFPQEADNQGPVVVVQKAGECVFVPSGLQHQVVNLEETLSINHNWITSANILRTFQCIEADIKAVDEWTDDTIDCEGKENMLRGNSGIDITAFLFMILLGVVETQESIILDDDERVTALATLRIALKRLLEGEQLQLKERLCGSLGDDSLGEKALNIAHRLHTKLDAGLLGYQNLYPGP